MENYMKTLQANPAIYSREPRKEREKIDHEDSTNTWRAKEIERKERS